MARSRECLRDPQVEAVYIATPNRTHLEFALKAAEAGKHVLCEKPLAVTTAECRQMIEVCRRNRVKLMVAYRKYFEPAALAFKALIDSGKTRAFKAHPHGIHDLSCPPGIPGI